MEFKPPALPFLVVDDPARCRDFWIEVLGFSSTFEDTPDDRLDFVVLQSPGEASAGGDPITLEYQRFDGLDPQLRARIEPGSTAMVYTWVHGVDALADSIAARRPECIVSRRRADYGADEITISDPHGHLFVFGERLAPRPDAD